MAGFTPRFSSNTQQPQASVAAPTYAGSTNFGTAEAPPQQQLDPNWKPDPKNPYNPPPGLPASLWKAYVDGARAAFPNAPIDKLLPGMWSNDPNNKFNVKAAWQNMSTAQQKQYTDADASGNPHAPNTAEADLWDKQNKEEGVQETNQAEFQQWEDEFMPGVKDAMAAARSGDQQALDNLKVTLGGIKDPKLAKYVGDYMSQGATAAADPRDIEAQQRQLSKLEGLSDPRITAEEKLMMEMSRRQTEGDLRAQRGALTNNLQARGVYGSGQELTQNMMAQSEGASRHALELLGAQSNASKRAIEALKGAGDLSTEMRKSGAQESQFRGTAADKAAEFNNGLKSSYNEWKAKQEAELNRDREHRATTAYDATTGQNSNTIKDSVAVADLGLRGTQGKTGQLSGDQAPVSASYKDQAALDEKHADEKKLANL